MISEDALTAITGIAPDSIATYSTTAPGLSAAANSLRADETVRLSTLTVQLSEEAIVDDAQRLQAIIETLTLQFKLTHENIARLTRARLEDLEAFVSDPTSVAWEIKFALAVRVYYLFHAVLNAATK
jgi:hypothetical protein